QTVARKRAGQFSLGMGQRLGIASALLGDPATVMLDEPVNGLDPEGVLWVRNLMKFLAGQGRTILVSSHLMNEMAVTADHLIVIGKGKLIAAASTADVIARGTEKSVKVRTPDGQKLTELITAAGGEVSAGTDEASKARLGAGQPGEEEQPSDSELLTVKNMEAPHIGELAASASLVLHELTPQLASLEEVFMDLTAGSLEFGVHDAAAMAAAGDGGRPAGEQLDGQVGAHQGSATQGSAS
ncbi:MAG: hypothetical protein LBV34_18760, partial [Nocardiopsaceae bacterium]|nr:hypothetical protein [Nocardiopsaceae bacterium]